jgi:hypothetical protein
MRQRRRYLILLAMLTCGGCTEQQPLAEPDWKFVSIMEGTRSAYVDANSITRRNGLKYGWARFERADRGEELEYSAWNCAERSSAALSWSERDAQGRVLRDGSTKLDDATFEPVIPGSVGAAIYDAVCADRWPEWVPVDSEVDNASNTNTATGEPPPKMVEMTDPATVNMLNNVFGQ